MRCSSCSEVIKPVVALDIDGTLGDYHGHLQAFAAGYLGRPEIAELPWAGDVNMNESWGIGLREYREIKLAYRQGGMKRTMPVYPLADWLTEALHQEGCEIWIATTRPWLRLDNIDPDTRWWLEHHRIGFDYIIYGEDKYWQLIQRVDCDRIIAVVDDLPEQLYEAETYIRTGVAIQAVTRWNRNARAHVTQAYGLDDALHQIRKRLAAWHTNIHDNNEEITS